MKRITTKLVLDVETMQVLEHEYYWHDGPLAECKGGDTAKAQMERQNQLQQQAFDLQKAKLDEIDSAFKKYITGAGEGYDPQLLALLKSQFLNENSAAYNNAGLNVRAAIAARGGAGGSLPVGGDFVRGIGALEAGKAGSQSQGLLNIGIGNLQQALQNRFQTGNLLAGQPAVFANNVSTFGSGASSALESYIKGVNSGPLNSLLGGLGEGFGKGFGGAFGGGLGSYLGGGLFGGKK